MSKIKISMDKMSVVADVENAEYLFLKIANELFSNSIGKQSTKRVLERLESEKEAFVTNGAFAGKREVEEEKDENELRYKGFIYWKCEDCGNVRGFCISKLSKGIHCMHCGSDHLFEKPLRSLFAECECGKTFHYLTNLEDDMFDLDCMHCGSPIPIKWNENEKIYETIK